MCCVASDSKNWGGGGGVGHFDNESKITEKKIVVSTRNPDKLTIKCTGRVARKATVSFVMSACQFARPVKQVASEWTEFTILHIEILYYNSVQKIQI